MTVRACARLLGLALLVVLLVACGGGIAAPAPVPSFTPLPSPSPERTTTPIPVLPDTPTWTPRATPASLPPTPSPSPTPTGVRFAVIGDFGMAGPGSESVSALIQGWAPDLILTTGDNNYPSGAAETIDRNIGQYYQAYIHPYRGTYGPGATENRFFPTLGNHDWDTAAAQAYLDYFTLPGNERYYDFAWGPVHYFALDSDSREPDGVSARSTQAAWLQEALGTASEPWKVVYMHLPPYSSGRHGSIEWMRWPFQEWGASLVLSGHDHLYERLSVDGLTYLIVGLGGFNRYPFLDPLPFSQVRFNGDYGALRVEADWGQMRVQFITQSGEIVDEFTLTPMP